MHLLLPFASATSAAASQVLHDLALPNLARLLARLGPTRRDTGDAQSLSPPHERALAQAWGWRGGDGLLPFAAHSARADGVPVGDAAWGLLTPTHWHVGRDHVVLVDPAALDLDETQSRALFDAVRGLFESEGFRLAWGTPQRWYAAHESLAALPCAALDRVIGRNVEHWMPAGAGTGQASTRLIRRLQSEVQLLLYPHPVNEVREADGALPMNSFWLSGCGRAQPADEASVQVDAALRAPLLGEDWAGWADAWRGVDSTSLHELAQRVDAGEPASLTLCGERSAQRFDAAPRSAWQRIAARWSAAAPHTVLEAL